MDYRDKTYCYSPSRQLLRLEVAFVCNPRFIRKREISNTFVFD